MKDAKIFLVDLHVSSGLGETLRKILDSCTHFRIQMHYEPFEGNEQDIYKNRLLKALSCCKPDLVLFVLSSDKLRQLAVLLESKERQISNLPIIVVSEKLNPDEMFTLLAIGVDDFVYPPIKETYLVPKIWRLIKHTRQKKTLISKLKEELGLKQLVGDSPVFLKEIKKIPVMAKCDASVLISGETGTGKELCARAIHYLSPRSSKPFIPISCGAIPTELVENELFGHIRGAFTGADSLQPGLIHEADGGSLFLDEIDCLPFQVQVKLLRFLQEKEYRMLGSTKICRVDVRIIASTNINLEESVKQGRFRQDLFYRINIIPLLMPPLRDRKTDVPVLARHFLSKYALEFNKRVNDFTSEALQKLIVYDWPGNIRELENVIERAVVFSKQMVIESDDVVLPRSEAVASAESFKSAKAKTIAEFEKNYIQGLLFANQGNITQAAKAAEKNRRAFWELIRKYKIDIQSFKSDYS